jgi:hypothetical protein
MDHPRNLETAGHALSKRLEPVPDLIRENRSPYVSEMLKNDENQSFIEDEEVIKKILKHLGLWPVESLQVEREVIKKILKHLGLWERKTRPPPKAALLPDKSEYSINYSSSQLLPDSDPPACLF